MFVLFVIILKLFVIRSHGYAMRMGWTTEMVLEIRCKITQNFRIKHNFNSLFNE